MDDTMEIFLAGPYFFALFLYFIFRIMFAGIFGPRIKESKRNNKDNPNAKK